MELKYYGNNEQKIDPSVYIADTASVVGDVEIGANSSVWFGAVIRADNNKIKLGANTNVQDGAVLHADPANPAVVGDNVTIGHRAIVHGCTVGSDTLIGMGAILLSGCRVGSHCVIGAGAIVTGKMDIPDNSLVLGAPAKTIKPLGEEMLGEIAFAAEEYVIRGQQFKNGEFTQTR